MVTTSEFFDAAERGDIATMEQFLDAGGDINAHCGEIIAETFIPKFADADGKTRVNQPTALHIAAQHGQIEAMKWLIAHKADVNARTQEGWVPMHAACANAHVEAALLLAKHGGNPNDKANDKAFSPIDAAKATIEEVNKEPGLQKQVGDKLNQLRLLPELLIKKYEKHQPDVVKPENVKRTAAFAQILQ